MKKRQLENQDSRTLFVIRYVFVKDSDIVTNISFSIWVILRFVLFALDNIWLEDEVNLFYTAYLMVCFQSKVFLQLFFLNRLTILICRYLNVDPTRRTPMKTTLKKYWLQTLNYCHVHSRDANKKVYDQKQRKQRLHNLQLNFSSHLNMQQPYLYV